MKKRVRVYKPGGQTNQPTQEQIVDYISQRMSADDFDGDTDSLKAELSQAGIEDAMADDYISYVSDNLGLEDNAQLDEETQAAAEQEQANADEEQALLEEQQAAEEQARQQQQEAMYNVEINPEDTEDTPEDEDTYMKQGGTNLSKRSFIKQYTKFAKMAQGGDTPSPGSDDVPNGRKDLVNGFLGAVRNTANDAVLKQEAENEYNSAYGAPQVGAFQEGGIHQEEIDFENPLHHLSTYGTDTRHIFSDDMYTQNDVAAMEQFGGNTGQGLYKFIGGGDNESADEEYQDADIDFNQEEYQMGGFRMPGRSGRQYAQAVNSPYYTATGERAAAPNLAGRQVTSVDVTKRGIFGRPKAYTVNYGNPNATASNTTQQIKMPSEDQAKKLDAKYAVNDKANTIGVKTPPAPGEYTGPDEFTGRRQPLANFMMRTGIPGIKDLGAKMIKSGPAPEVPNVIPETFGTNDLQKRDSYGAPIVNKTAETFPDSSYDKRRLPPSTIPETFGTDHDRYNYDNDAITKGDNSEQIGDQIEELRRKSLGKNFQKYGGPIDYTEYAYGGDISIPELYRVQAGAQVAFDPNANNMNFSNLQGFFDKTPTKDITGQPIQATVPESMQPKNITIDPNQPNKEAVTDQPDNYSQDYKIKKDWGKIGSDVADVAAVGKVGLLAGLDTLDKINANKQEKQLLENTTSAEANYGISNADNRGNYDPNSGLFRPDQMGSNAVVKFGGGIYAMGGNTMDEDEDVEYMTEDQIKRFLAEGGELEYV